MTVHTELPTGYAQALYYPITSRRLLIALNIAMLVPLFIFGTAMYAYWNWYEQNGAPLTLTFLDIRLLPSGWDPIAFLALLILTFPLHELCHGLSFKWVGVARVKYGIIPKRLVLYAKPEGTAYFYRNDFILGALAPLILITLGGIMLLAVMPPGTRMGIALAVALNAGGAIGDIWTVIIILLRRFPADALVQDLGDTFVIYTPATDLAEG